MSQSKKQPNSSRRVTPRLESLENRSVPAGNVTAFVSGGVLHVIGDSESNQIAIVSSGRRSVIVHALDSSTTINGNAGPVNLERIRKGYNIQLGGGDDSINISGTDIRRELNLDTGDGDDSINMFGVRSRRNSTVNTGSGNDNFNAFGSNFRRALNLNAGGGDDQVSIGSTKIRKRSTIDGSDGTNALSLQDNNFRRQPTFLNFGGSTTPPANGTQPTANPDTATVNQGGTVQIFVAANDVPNSGDFNATAVTITRNPQFGTATVNADGSVTYTNTTTATTDSFGYTIRNTAGGVSAEANVAITITDQTTPSVTLATTANSPTGTNPIPFTATFSEDVNGFTAEDVTVTNGTVINFVAVDARSYTFNVTATADGQVTVVIPAGAGTNTAGTGNSVSNTVTVTFDDSATGPTVTANPLATSDTTPTVTGTVSDSAATVSVTIDNQTFAGVVSGNTFTATVPQALAEGTYTIFVTATNTAGLTGTGQATNGLVIDLTGPTLALTSTASDPTSAATIPVTAVFSEDVTGFAVSAIGVSNATVTNFLMVDARTYTFSVIPAGPGLVTIDVTAGAAQDAAGNGNTPASFNITSVEGPEPSIVLANSDPTNANPILVSVVFDRNVTGFVANDVTVTNGTLSNFQALDGQFYGFDIIPTGDGLITIDIAAGAAIDSNGIESSAATSSITSDRTVPTAIVSTTENDPTNANPIPFAVTFSEGVTGFTEAGLTVTNGTITNFIPVNSRRFTFDVVPTNNGLVTVDVAADAADDAAGNGNTAATFSITSAGTSPVPTITTTETDPTAANPIPFTVSFNEDVTGFNEVDVAVTNGTLTNFVAVDARTFTFDVMPTAEGLVTVEVAAAGAQDLDGNDNLAATFSITSDATGPVATISSTSSNPTNDIPIPIAVDFNEDVTGFTVSDVTVTNGTVTNFVAVNDRTYTFDVTPTADGFVMVDVAADAAQDGANNGNAAATFSVLSDATAPVATISSTATDPTNVSPIPFTVTFSENVTDFIATDVMVTNGTVMNFLMVDAQTFTFEVTPTVDGTVTVNIAANAARDLASGGNAAATFSIVSDTTAPIPAISSTEIDPTNANPIPFNIVFNEDVFGFTESDLMVTNGTVVNFLALNGQIYGFDVIPAAEGTVTIDIPAGVAQDLAGNDNAAATFSIVFDSTAPVVTIDPTSDGRISGDVPEAATSAVTVTLSISNGVLFWDGSAFASNTEVFFTAGFTGITSWSLTFGTPGTYTVHAIAVDAAGNQGEATMSVMVT